MLDAFLFGVFPYLALALAVGGTLYRRRALRDTLGARSTQLLESRLLYWGSLPWHPAILVILAGSKTACRNRGGQFIRCKRAKRSRLANQDDMAGRLLFFSELRFFRQG